MPAHSSTKSLRRVFRAAGLAGVLAVAVAGAAQAGNVKVGWLWANQPNATATYTPDTSYSYNSVGGYISVTPFATGLYRIDFGKLYSASPSNVQVSAYGTNGYCTASGWGTQGAGNAAEMWVTCFNASGTPAKNYFTLLYQDRATTFGSSAKGIAFLYADQPSAASYTPQLTYNYNSTGVFNTIVRNSVGNYSVTIPGLSKQGGNVQVTGYNAYQSNANPVRCKVQVWGSNGSANVARVECFNSSGAPADELFSLAFALNVPFGFTTAAHSKGAYAWADKPTDKHVYTPDKIWNYSGFGTGRMTSQKIGTGDYTVNIPGGISYSQSLALVTGYDNGTGSAYCNIVDWFAIEVQCYQQGGTPLDSEFNVAFQTTE